MARNAGAALINATVTNASFIRDPEPAVHSVTTVDRDGQQAMLPCTDLVIAAGPWSGNLASQILPMDLGLRSIPIVGERAHSIIVQADGRLTAHAIFSRIYDQGRWISDLAQHALTGV